MKYIIDCRKKGVEGNISGVQFKGFGEGLPDKKMANKVFNKEVKSDNWDAVYMEKLYSNGTSIGVKEWYKEGAV